MLRLEKQVPNQLIVPIDSIYTLCGRSIIVKIPVDRLRIMTATWGGLGTPRMNKPQRKILTTSNMFATCLIGSITDNG